MKARYIFLSLGTVIVLIFGAFFPNIIFILQDNNVETQVNQYAINTIQFDIDSPTDVSDILRLIAGNTKMMDLESGKKRHAQQAYLSALEALAFFTEGDMEEIKKAYTIHKEFPVLVTNKDWTDAAVIWQCQLSNKSEDTEITMLLDDESGKMLAFQYIGPKEQLNLMHDKGYVQAAEAWSDICAVYYGFDVVDVIDKNSQERSFAHLFIDSRGEELELNSTIRDVSNRSDDDKHRIYFSFNNNYKQSTVAVYQ